MNIITLSASLIVMLQLLLYERCDTDRFKPTVNASAYLIILAMSYQAICIGLNSHDATLFQTIITVVLAFGSVYYHGNVSHLVKGISKIFRRILYNVK